MEQGAGCSFSTKSNVKRLKGSKDTLKKIVSLRMEPWAHVLVAGELPLSHIPSPEETVTIKEDCRSPGFKMTKYKKSQEENWN